jgi:hypothetical protein
LEVALSPCAAQAEVIRTRAALHAGIGRTAAARRKPACTLVRLDHARLLA